MIIANSDNKVKIDEETVLFILCEYDVADRYVAVKDTSLKERLMPMDGSEEASPTKDLPNRFAPAYGISGLQQRSYWALVGW